MHPPLLGNNYFRVSDEFNGYTSILILANPSQQRNSRSLLAPFLPKSSSAPGFWETPLCWLSSYLTGRSFSVSFSTHLSRKPSISICWINVEYPSFYTRSALGIYPWAFSVSICTDSQVMPSGLMVSNTIYNDGFCIHVSSLSVSPKLQDCMCNCLFNNSPWICNRHLKLNMPNMKLLTVLSLSQACSYQAWPPGITSNLFTGTFSIYGFYHMAL